MDMRNEKGQFEKGTHWRNEKPWWDKAWLENEYIVLQKSAGDIANEHGIGDTAIHYWLKKHGIKTRTTAETRKIKYWAACGPDNPMWNKYGELNPMWKGGITPDRQLLYSKYEWKQLCKKIWNRDKSTCQRCDLKKEDRSDMPFHIHHIEPFEKENFRMDINNLVLLCETCHCFVHSKRNVTREYLPKE